MNADLLKLVVDRAIPIALKLVGAVVLWAVGRLVIRGAQKVVRAGSKKRGIDPTLGRYLDSLLGAGLTLLLVVALLGVLGIETTSFAALLAAGGIAIGTAWSGLLSNFAAGAFLVVLRPFRVGEVITACGITGAVQHIGMFVTTLDQADGIRVVVGNGKLFGEPIINFTVNPTRRVDLTVQLAHGVDPFAAMALLRREVEAIPEVAKDPAPTIEILSFTAAGPLLCVRPSTHDRHYWDVHFACTRTIARALAAYPTPAVPYVLQAGAALDASPSGMPAGVSAKFVPIDAG